MHLHSDPTGRKGALSKTQRVEKSEDMQPKATRMGNLVPKAGNREMTKAKIKAIKPNEANAMTKRAVERCKGGIRELFTGDLVNRTEESNCYETAK
jgi:hypothetical protein